MSKFEVNRNPKEIEVEIYSPLAAYNEAQENDPDEEYDDEYDDYDIDSVIKPVSLDLVMKLAVASGLPLDKIYISLDWDNAMDGHYYNIKGTRMETPEETASRVILEEQKLAAYEEAAAKRAAAKQARKSQTKEDKIAKLKAELSKLQGE